MGLLKAGAGALGGALADSWREYFYCEAISSEILAVKGVKRTGSRSSNTKGTDNIISNGSIIAVADGQCMIIVDQGKVSEVCAEPGEFLYDSSTEPSIFFGGLNKENLKKSFASVGKRFTFGGEPPKDQRIYYFNTKEIVGNKYGTPNPVPFRVVDKNIGLDIDIGIRCNGEFSYRLVDPILFYTNVCGNVADEYNRSEIDSMLRTELMTALQPAFAKISEMGIRYSALPGHTTEMADALNEILSKKWGELRGLKVWSFGINSMNANEEDEAMIKELQKNAVLRDPTMAGATLVGAQAEAMKAAASNTSTGPFMAFAGMGMAQNMGGQNAQNLFAMGANNGAPNQQYGAAQGYAAPQQYGENGNAAAGSWKCECGSVNTGKFCMNCGKAQPAPAPAPAQNGWTCKCGAVNTGKFCSQCGAKQPVYKCNKCGWTPEDAHNPPKFCPNCGDVFDSNDAE